MLQNVMKNNKCMKNLKTKVSFAPISAHTGPSKILSNNISFSYVSQIDNDVLPDKIIFVDPFLNHISKFLYHRTLEDICMNYMICGKACSV